MSDEIRLDQVDRRCVVWGTRRNRQTTKVNRAAEDREWLLFRAYELARALELLLRVVPVNTNSSKARKALTSFDGRKR